MLFYYDMEKIISKYKLKLKCARMSNNIRTDKYIYDVKYSWDIIFDVWKII